MTTLTNNLNEQLFTELTPEESAVIGGGKLIKTGNVNFDYLVNTKTFKNNIGTKIQVNTNTRSGGKLLFNGSNKLWGLRLQRANKNGTYTTVGSQLLLFNGKQKALFTGLATGGTYRLQFFDDRDGKKVVGSYEVYD
jgi:hypothetical protein